MATASTLSLPLFSLTATPELPTHTPQHQSRRPTHRQGAALEMLGHAIEYLIDSRLYEGGATDAEQEAVRMLMRCSRAVFAECAETVPVRRRVSAWFAAHLRLPV